MAGKKEPRPSDVRITRCMEFPLGSRREALAERVIIFVF